jgi:hypothetical protein
MQDYKSSREEESSPEGRGGRVTGQVQSRCYSQGVGWQCLDQRDAAVSAVDFLSKATRVKGQPESCMH